MSSAKSNFGTLLKIGDGMTPEVFTTIPEVTLIPAIEEEQEEVEVTHHGSTGKEFIMSGITDPGELEFEMNSLYPDTTQDEIRAMKISGEVANFQIIRPNGLGKQFSAYVKNIVENDADAQSIEAIKETVTLRLTGGVIDISDDSL
jgi:hypothetical protein